MTWNFVAIALLDGQRNGTRNARRHFDDQAAFRRFDRGGVYGVEAHFRIGGNALSGNKHFITGRIGGGQV